MRPGIIGTTRVIPATRFGKSIFAAATVLVAAIAFPAQAQRLSVGLAQPTPPGMMGRAEASALQLEQIWLESISLPYGVSTLVDIAIFVDTADPVRYLEITAAKPDNAGETPSTASAGNPEPSPGNSGSPVDSPTVLMRLKFGTVGPEGRMVDEREAERLATNEIRRLKRRGYQPSKRTVTSPRVYIYSLANDGTLQKRDAETGELAWQIGVGDPVIGYGELGISANHVLVTNGANMIEIATGDGRIVDTMRLRYTPSFGAISVGKYGIVHAFGGNVDIFDLTDISQDPYHERVRGSALARPVSAADSLKVAWPTSEGFVYVTELSGAPSTVFRLDVDGIVSGGIAAGPGDTFFFGSSGGQAYSMRATTSGEVLWTESIGLAIVDQPILLDERLFVLTEFGELFCLNAADGTRMWNNNPRNIGRLYAGFAGKLYAEDLAGRFKVIDVTDGSVVQTPVHFEPTKVVVNTQTNRLYLVDSRGLLQCLRPMGSDLPTMIAGISPAAEAANQPEAAEEETVAAAEAKPKPEVKDPFAAGGDDPFGAGDDPFGAMDGGDPFGAGDGNDPFGGDPFGGDPFN